MDNKDKRRMLESKINLILSEKLENTHYHVLNELRLSPAEFDLILMDSKSLQLINIEIKRNNWRKLFQQALRGKLYCHYSIVLAPYETKKNIDIKLFSEKGIGLMFYKELENDIELYFELIPILSNEINRTFKMILYQQLHSKYGDLIYA